MKINFEARKEPYMIGEVGINHNGDIQIAKKLMDAVFACNWDCVKFQKRNPDVCVPDNQKGKMRETPWGMMTYLDYKYKVEFDKYEYDYIDDYCKEKPIDWTASVWDIDSLNFIMNYEVPFIKIPSAMLTNLELLKEAAKTNVTLIISTGMSTIDEIDIAVNLITKYGDKPIIMHTNSSYPTPHSEINLNLIPVLKERYDCTIGYSGHEYGLEPTVIAVALGAKIIERHITLSHDLWGTDQKSSLEVHAMSMLQKRTCDISNMLGSKVKEVTPSELPVREKLRG
ncbi:MAG: N-acetylneuraminate synthase family protein [Candidatus Thermoplasmatota archaeon]|nr:N-acetylneuraminate synthase family protein [Candidatus Thermoplasmatota archaeon]